MHDRCDRCARRLALSNHPYERRRIARRLADPSTLQVARPPQQTARCIVPPFAKLLGRLSARAPRGDPGGPLRCSRHARQRATRGAFLLHGSVNRIQMRAAACPPVVRRGRMITSDARDACWTSNGCSAPVTRRVGTGKVDDVLRATFPARDQVSGAREFRRPGVTDRAERHSLTLPERGRAGARAGRRNTLGAAIQRGV